MKLLAAGSFVTDAEKQEFDGLMNNPEFAGAVDCLGFVSGSKKGTGLARSRSVLFSHAVSGGKSAGDAD